MPGSWEIRQAQQVFTAMLSIEFTTMNWALGFRRLILPGPDPQPISGMPYDHARNQAVAMFLNSPCRYLFFLDTDVVAPRDAVLRLMSHDLPIVSGVYYRRSPPIGVPVVQKPLGNWMHLTPHTGLVEADVVGAGCLLLRRDVLEKIPAQRQGKHWFDWRVDAINLPPGERLSEDFTFCMWAKKHGYKVMVDTGIQCSHQGFAESRAGFYGPTNQLPLP